MSWILVFFGGGLGCLCRYAMSLIWPLGNVHNFPLSTFISNNIACFIVGLLSQYLLKYPNYNLSLLIVTGFCGGFSTFSSFGLETLQLIQSGYVQKALTYLLVSNISCILMVMLGFITCKYVLNS